WEPGPKQWSQTKRSADAMQPMDQEEVMPDIPQDQPRDGVALTVYPRREDIAPVDEWLSRAVPESVSYITVPDSPPVLEWTFRGQDLIAFIRLWSGRPRNAKYFGNKSFQDFLKPRQVPSFTLKVEPSGVNWLDVSVEMEHELDAISTRDILAALDASEDELLLLPGGRLYERGDLEGYRKRLESLQTLGLDLTPGVQRVHAMQLVADAGGALERLSDDVQAFQDFARQARELLDSFKGVPAAKIPEPTVSALRPYQRLGADFLVWAAETFGGAVLADDMGLGKTITLLAALSALRKKRRKRLPSLVVCPASVAHNWKREADRFAPGLKTIVIERGAERKELLNHLNEYDLVIKNYALTRRDADVLGEQEWLAICVDEAQAIKNPKSQIALTVKGLHSQYRFALTGTPIENRLSDLWSIVDFVTPGYLGSLDSFDQRSKGKSVEFAYRMLRARLRPVLMRRLKSEVAPELPPRIEERRDCEMTTGQRKAYLAEVKKARLLLDSASDDRVTGKYRIMILAALTRLRQICCDPPLVGLTETGSGKVDALFELVTPLLEAGHKVLLFSQFVRMIRRIETMLGKRDIPFRVLTGETQHRQELVDEFERDETPGVFLISLKAGGQGLNLVSASHVILFDPWWNPAVEAQAIDRTHRIGQDKTVIAFRLVTLGTVEERIIELQERKRSMIKNVLEEGAFNRSLNREDFEFIQGE
ncbi:MAG: hypothetical protein QG656_2221, partial [Candidatus Hydrogenedentes bacterium]|nr:hypothetical protein [Candidatus Hydrogenedentota bacterium]